MLKSELSSPVGDCGATLVAAIGQTRVAVAVCDVDFRPIFFNAAAAALLNIPESPQSDDSHLDLFWRVAQLDPGSVRTAVEHSGFWRDRRTIVSDGAVSREVDIEVSGFHDGSVARLMMIAREVWPATSMARLASDTDLINGSPHLTQRERDVMLGLLRGDSSKVIGKNTAISPRTVEFHRAKLMRRFAATSSVELIQKVIHGERPLLVDRK